MAWIHKDPESGFYHDEFGGTHVYENGKTLAEEFPQQYFQCPVWAAWILEIADLIHRQAMNLCGHWDKRERESGKGVREDGDDTRNHRGDTQQSS